MVMLHAPCAAPVERVTVIVSMEASPPHTTEFTVAPMIVQQGQGKSYHEWLVEFEQAPDQLEAFADCLDQQLRDKNVYYDDLIRGNILDRLKVSLVRKNGFIDYMKQIGKLGGQNKVPRLSNDRNLANGLEAFLQS